ncbi:LppU/SCO3897 family protein [Nocardia stercoris]|uniref:LppU/SCO3897 family protein n=1 Tax=Nocardia stercoris TaxID=2483361 RepID=UPI0011C49D70|nr:hypothetical protein [Nocardia stercoris]
MIAQRWTTWGQRTSETPVVHHLTYEESVITGYRYADCGTPDASFRVVSRVDGRSDESLCGDDSDKVITLAQPPTTFCVKDQ